MRHTLNERYEVSASALRLRDAWLVGQLLTQIQVLLAPWERAGGVPAEVRRRLADVLALAQEAGVTAAPPGQALTWLLRVEQVLFGSWKLLTDNQVRCPNCGSTQVGRKSATPRLKQ